MKMFQRQNVLYAALNTIFTTQEQQSTKSIKNEMKECSYEIQTAALNTDSEDVMSFKPYLSFYNFQPTSVIVP